MDKKTKKIEMCEVSDDVLELLQKDIAEIKVALLGNAYNPSGGLLYRVTSLEKEIDCNRTNIHQMRMKYERILWTVAGGATVIAVIANLIMKWFDKVVM